MPCRPRRPPMTASVRMRPCSAKAISAWRKPSGSRIASHTGPTPRRPSAARSGRRESTPAVRRSSAAAARVARPWPSWAAKASSPARSASVSGRPSAGAATASRPCRSSSPPPTSASRPISPPPPASRAVTSAGPYAAATTRSSQARLRSHTTAPRHPSARAARPATASANAPLGPSAAASRVAASRPSRRDPGSTMRSVTRVSHEAHRPLAARA